MLPSKGYFNSLECPFYLSSVQCLRPYCHFKHPKRSTKTEVSEEKVEDSIRDHVGVSTATVISAPVEEKPVVAPVKHIPIAYIPTKPSAVSVNIKNAKSVYVPSVKNDTGRTCIVGSTDYHPSTVMDSSEKTYSRYSYEKGHDSGDEIMENYKNLIETNTIGKPDDGSKSGYDEETDYYPEEPEFSPPNSPDEEDVESLALSSQLSDFKSEQPDDTIDKDLKIKKKRKYSEINETKAINEYTKNHDGNFTKIKTENNEDNLSANGSPKRIKTEKTVDISPKKIKSEKRSNDPLLKIIKNMEDSNHAASSESKISEKKETKNKDKKHSSNSHKHSQNKSKEHSNQKVSSDSKKQSSDKNHSKSTEKHSGKSHSSDKKLSSSSNKHGSHGKSENKVISSDSKKSSSESSHKHSSESKKHSSESKIHLSESKIHLSESKIHLPESKIHLPESKIHSSESEKHSSESKKHSSESKIHSSESKKHSSESKKHSSKDKKHSSGSRKPEKEHSSTSKNQSDKKHSVNKNCKKSSSSNKHPSENKKNSSSHSKKKQNEKVKSSGKSKEDPVKNKTADKKHSEGRKDSNKKKDYHKSSSSSSKHKHDKNKSNRCGNHEDRRSETRKHSESSDSVISSNDVKETILISDSSDSEEAERKSLNNYSPVGVDEIFGPSASSDDNRLSDDGGNYHDGASDSENDNEYTPTMPFFNSRESPAYKPSSSSSNTIGDETNYRKNFITAPQVSTEDSYKPAQTVSKVRIAHVPNVSSLLSAKTMIGTGKTVSTNAQKLAKCMDMLKSRVTARTLPQNASNHRPKPQVTANLNSVVSVNIRQPGLNNIYDELIKYVDYDDAYRRAVEEENEICNVATNPQSYRNRIALCILRIRKSKGAVDVVQKERITSGSVPDYTYGLTLYECFSKYLLKPEDYVLHGYPLEIPDRPGCAYIDKNSFFRSKKVDQAEGGQFKKCINCGKEYAIDEETGIPLTKNNCHHHWGKLIGMRQGKIYTCCKSEVGSDPCHTSTYHVTELKNEDCLEGFVKTRPYPSDADPNKAGIYAMDCEMCFTTRGRDIVRASLLAVDNESFYDVLIKPKHPILDYCTRFSGITEEKLVSVTTTLEEVQRFLLKTINEKTILVGHSLENDLKALKLLHFNVVDTSLMFPHKEGFPVKCALRTLCSRLLGTAIQTGENGHDSLEDARGCLQLVLHQVREDAKARKPRVVKQLKTNK